MNGEVGKTSKRPPPGVAEANAADALANLVRKRDALVAALRGNSQRIGRIAAPEGGVPLELLPKSLRQFNRWSMPADGGTSSKPLRSNSNDTLSRHPDLKEQIVRLIEATREARHRTSGGKRIDSLASLRRRLALAESLRSIAEVELVKTRLRLVSLNSDIRRLNSALDSSVAAYREQIDLLRSQLAEAKTHVRASLGNRPVK
jgi:hypothetical protein